MNTIFFLSAFLQSTDGLTTNTMIDSLPRDPASIFALLVILISAGAIMWFGRPKGGGGNEV